MLSYEEKVQSFYLKNKQRVHISTSVDLTNREIIIIHPEAIFIVPHTANLYRFFNAEPDSFSQIWYERIMRASNDKGFYQTEFKEIIKDDNYTLVVFQNEEKGYTTRIQKKYYDIAKKKAVNWGVLNRCLIGYTVDGFPVCCIAQVVKR